MEQKLKNLEEEFQTDLRGVAASEDLEELRVKYLGRKSALSKLFSEVPGLSKEEKGLWGKILNVY